MRGKYEKCTHSLGSQKREKPIHECNKEALWDDDVRTFYSTQQGTKTKSNMFFSLSQQWGGEGNIVANRSKALGRLGAAMNQTKD